MAKAMTCPACGAEMNHHANKVVYGDAGAGSIELIEEFHSCPNCGRTESRASE